MFSRKVLAIFLFILMISTLTFAKDAAVIKQECEDRYNQILTFSNCKALCFREFASNKDAFMKECSSCVENNEAQMCTDQILQCELSLNALSEDYSLFATEIDKELESLKKELAGLEEEKDKLSETFGKIWQTMKGSYENLKKEYNDLLETKRIFSKENLFLKQKVMKEKIEAKEVKTIEDISFLERFNGFSEKPTVSEERSQKAFWAMLSNQYGVYFAGIGTLFSPIFGFAKYAAESESDLKIVKDFYDRKIDEVKSEINSLTAMKYYLNCNVNVYDDRIDAIKDDFYGERVFVYQEFPLSYMFYEKALAGGQEKIDYPLTNMFLNNSIGAELFDQDSLLLSLFKEYSYLKNSHDRLDLELKLFNNQNFLRFYANEYFGTQNSATLSDNLELVDRKLEKTKGLLKDFVVSDTVPTTASFSEIELELLPNLQMNVFSDNLIEEKKMVIERFEDSGNSYGKVELVEDNVLIYDEADRAITFSKEEYDHFMNLLLQNSMEDIDYFVSYVAYEEEKFEVDKSKFYSFIEIGPIKKLKQTLTAFEEDSLKRYVSTALNTIDNLVNVYNDFELANWYIDDLEINLYNRKVYNEKFEFSEYGKNLMLDLPIHLLGKRVKTQYDKEASLRFNSLSGILTKEGVLGLILAAGVSAAVKAPTQSVANLVTLKNAALSSSRTIAKGVVRGTKNLFRSKISFEKLFEAKTSVLTRVKNPLSLSRTITAAEIEAMQANLNAASKNVSNVKARIRFSKTYSDIIKMVKSAETRTLLRAQMMKTQKLITEAQLETINSAVKGMRVAIENLDSKLISRIYKTLNKETLKLPVEFLGEELVASFETGPALVQFTRYFRQMLGEIKSKGLDKAEASFETTLRNYVIQADYLK